MPVVDLWLFVFVSSCLFVCLFVCGGRASVVGFCLLVFVC